MSRGRHRDLEEGLRKLAKHAPEGVRRGMAKAGLRALRDAIMRAPTVPLDEGTLRGSGSLHVDGQFKEDTEGWPSAGGAPEPNRIYYPQGKKKDAVVATVGFNTEYAAYLHETAGLNWSEPSAGSGYLKNALENGDFEPIIGREIQKELKRLEGGL